MVMQLLLLLGLDNSVIILLKWFPWWFAKKFWPSMQGSLI